MDELVFYNHPAAPPQSTHLTWFPFSSSFLTSSNPNTLSVTLPFSFMARIQSQPTWPELLGSNNWGGLLEPLDLNLRKLILRCGDFVQATYDAFNNDQGSKYCGFSRYGKSSFFDKVMLEVENASDYKVAFFLYATAKVSVPEAFLLHSMSREAWDRESNWIGYIAVTTDEVSSALGRREIYVVWRGTTRNYEWADVMGAASVSAKPLLSAQTLKDIGYVNESSSSDNEDANDKMPKVMQGWLTIYTSDDPRSPFTKTSARTQVLKRINELLELSRNQLSQKLKLLDRMESQFQKLAQNPDIIIATPGKLMHHLSDVDDMSLRAEEHVVFEEADCLFGMGFAEQLHTILSQPGENRQTLLFSAMLSSALAEFAKAGLRDPKLVRLDLETKISPGWIWREKAGFLVDDVWARKFFRTSLVFMRLSGFVR